MDVTKYIETLFVQDDALRKEISDTLSKMDVSANLVSPIVAKTLYMFVKMAGAKHILEIGSLAGYSSIWLARGLQQPEGSVTSLEIRPTLVKLATENAQKAGLENTIQYIPGPAMQTLEKLQQASVRFDFFFIDADKVNYPEYLDKVLKLATPGALIIADNVLWRNRIFDLSDHDSSTESIREFNKNVAECEQLDSMLLPIGDGLIMAKVRNDGIV